MSGIVGGLTALAVLLAMVVSIAFVIAVILTGDRIGKRWNGRAELVFDLSVLVFVVFSLGYLGVM